MSYFKCRKTDLKRREEVANQAKCIVQQLVRVLRDAEMRFQREGDTLEKADSSGGSPPKNRRFGRVLKATYSGLEVVPTC